MNKWDGRPVKSWAEYVGRRCLVIEDRYCEGGKEVFVKEISPSKARVKFRFSSGVEIWENGKDWLLIECLE